METRSEPSGIKIRIKMTKLKKGDIKYRCLVSLKDLHACAMQYMWVALIGLDSNLAP